jgi:hypothetical protein
LHEAINEEHVDILRWGRAIGAISFLGDGRYHIS